MLDENGTEASREGALNAYESLFGDTVAAPPAELGKEQEVSIEPDQNQQGSDLDEEEQAVVAEIAPPDDLKVVVSIREGRASIGVQQLSSDPYIESFDDREVSKLAQEVPCGAGKGESQVGRRTQTSRLRATHSLDRASATARTATGAEPYR